MRIPSATPVASAFLTSIIGLSSLAAAEATALAPPATTSATIEAPTTATTLAPAPAEPTPTPAAAPAPAETVAPAPLSTTLASTAPSAPEPAPLTTPAAPVVSEEKPIPSYFRFDHDYQFGLQLWAGATYPLTDSLGLATDVYLAENYPTVSDAGAVQSWWGEFDIGPALTLGPLTVTPMAGIAFDWAAKRAVALNAPQLYTVVNLDKIYFESWIWTVLYSPFKNPVFNDYFHTRNWALYKLNGTIAVGPQFEFTYLLNDEVQAKGTSAMPLGAHVELSYGAGNSLGLFLGYELDKDVRETAGGNAAEGRLTFVHNF